MTFDSLNKVFLRTKIQLYLFQSECEEKEKQSKKKKNKKKLRKEKLKQKRKEKKEETTEEKLKAVSKLSMLADLLL